ncbi:MAG: PRC-barrel domain-containing protein [Candidatus Limnocylindrales bacterium]
MLEVTKNTDVYTADDRHVGSVDRIVLDPVTQQLTHVVVRKGIFFPEDKLIHFEDISTATPERINLRQGVDAAQLDPFVEHHFVTVDETDLPEGDLVYDPGFVSAWYGPIGVAPPMHRDALLSVSERNIPDRLLALEAGSPVLSSDHEVVGHLERVLATDDGRPTHLVIEDDGLSLDRRAMPIGWVGEITEEGIALGVTAHMVEAVVPLGPDE